MFGRFSVSFHSLDDFISEGILLLNEALINTNSYKQKVTNDANKHSLQQLFFNFIFLVYI